MGISFKEFETAMETYGATKVFGQVGSRYNVSVPCFNVAGINFLHSGSYYIVIRGGKVPKGILNKARAKFGEKYPGGDNFWYGEIHSVRGILTLALMLEGKYTKEMVNKLTDETYKKLLSVPLIQRNTKVPLKKAVIQQKWEEFYKLVLEYDNVANPFCNNAYLLKNPSEYLDKVGISISFSEKNGIVDSVKLNLKTKNSSTNFDDNEKGWYYHTNGWNDIEKGDESGYTAMGHYYNNGLDKRPIDEVVYLNYTTGGGYDERPGDIDLRISLMTGLAWRTYKEEDAAEVTDKQLEVMITHLKRSIERTKKIIIDEMIQK